MWISIASDRDFILRFWAGVALFLRNFPAIWPLQWEIVAIAICEFGRSVEEPCLEKTRGVIGLGRLLAAPPRNRSGAVGCSGRCLRWCATCYAIMCGTCGASCVFVGLSLSMLWSAEQAKSWAHSFWGKKIVYLLDCWYFCASGAYPWWGDIRPSVSRSPGWLPGRRRGGQWAPPSRGVHPQSCLVFVSFSWLPLRFCFGFVTWLVLWGLIDMDIFALQD